MRLRSTLGNECKMKIAMTVGTSLMTFEEFERLPEPEQPGKCELLEGELIQLPPAKKKHNVRESPGSRS